MFFGDYRYSSEGKDSKGCERESHVSRVRWAEDVEDF